VQVLITHLSKYGGSQACLAGVDRESGRFVRVKAPGGGFVERADLLLEGDPVGLGDILSFRPVSCRAHPPHHENVCYAPGSLRLEARDVRAELISTVDRLASPSLAVGFGGRPIQVKPRGSCMFETPQNSLCVVPAKRVERVCSETWDEGVKVKIIWESDGMEIRSALDDIRLYPTNDTVAEQVVAGMNERCSRPGRVHLACSIAELWNGGYWVLVAGLHFMPT
jgi:hypothetical protein